MQSFLYGYLVRSLLINWWTSLAYLVESLKYPQPRSYLRLLLWYIGFLFFFCLPNCRCHALIKLCLLMNIGRISWCCPTFLSHVENSALKKIGLHLLMYWWNLALVQTSFGSIASDDLQFFYLLSYWCTWRNLGFSPYNARYYMGDTQDW